MSLTARGAEILAVICDRRISNALVCNEHGEGRSFWTYQRRVAGARDVTWHTCESLLRNEYIFLYCRTSYFMERGVQTVTRLTFLPTQKAWSEMSARLLALDNIPVQRDN